MSTVEVFTRALKEFIIHFNEKGTERGHAEIAIKSIVSDIFDMVYISKTHSMTRENSYTSAHEFLFELNQEKNKVLLKQVQSALQHF